MNSRLKISGLRKFVLVFGDFLSFAAGLLLALGIRYGFPIPAEQLGAHRYPFGIIFIIWLLGFYVGGLYALRKAKNDKSFFALFLTVFGANAAVVVLFFYFIPYFSITPKTVLFLDLGITLTLTLGWRIIFNRVVSLPPLKIAVLGDGKEVDELLHELRMHPQHGYECAAHIKDEAQSKYLQKLVKDEEIDAIIVEMDYRNAHEVQKNLFECIQLRVQFFEFVDFYEKIMQKIPLAAIDKAWFLENLNESGKEMVDSLKRDADIFIALVLGVVGIILFPFVAAAIWLDSGRPLFYSQMRVGRFNSPFKIYKFRSMHIGGKDSVTRIGRFLRTSHLDEIPQLWNLLKGEMSFVGPRPEQVWIVEDLKNKVPFYTERLLVRPGITGWAQFFMPHAKADEALEKLQYDLFYIKHRSLLLDLQILLKTLRILLS
ncbi:sugar transferase [Candidatus Peregrinibacteria bacterium]|nr:sugar transferase [Candidatus Peregrinibacteria bacterium]